MADPEVTPHNARLRFFAALQRRRAVVLTLAGLMFAAALLSARHLPWNENILDLLPSSDPEVAQYREMLDTFGFYDFLYFDVGPVDDSVPVEENDLFKASDRLTESLEKSGLFERVLGRVAEEDGLTAYEDLRLLKANYFTEADIQRTENRLKPEALQKTLTDWKRRLQESPAPLLARVFARDPLGFDSLALDRLTSLRPQPGEGLQVTQGHLMTANGRHVLVRAKPTHPAGGGDIRTQTLVRTTEAAVRAAEATAPGAIRVAWMGAHRFSLENASRIKRDIALTLSLSVVAITTLILLTFSRPFLAFLALLPMTFGAAVATGLIPWIMPGISAIAIGSGSLLLGVAVDYGVHVAYHFDHPEGGQKRDTLMAHLVSPLLLSLATTLVAFLAMQVSTLPGTRQLGLFAALGIVGSSAFAVLALPLLFPATTRDHVRQPWVAADRLSPLLLRWVYRYRPLVACGLVMLTGFSAVGLTRLRIAGDPQQLNAMTPEIRADWDRVRSSFQGALDGAFLAVSAPDTGEALQENQRLASMLDELEKKGLILNYRSVANLFPSPTTQSANRWRWERFWTPKRIATLEANLTESAHTLGMRPERFQPFLESLRQPPPERAVNPVDFQNGVFRDLVQNQVAIRPDKTLVLTTIRLADPESFPSLVKRLREANPTLYAASGTHFVRYMGNLVVREMARMSLLALTVVLVLLFCSVRRPTRVAVLVLPFLLALVWTFGTLGWCGVPVNLMNSLTAILVFGLVADFSIFLSSAWTEPRDPDHPDTHLARAGGAVTLSALTTLFCLGSLALAAHPALRAIGLTASLGMAGGWLGALLTVPFLKPGDPVPATDEP
ncbi:MAG TPA: MMPL family transporter [Candidatus Sumerlaeota bacterium]|nr:MMPL family transporter [Candidatus Sumerlaeota bacterium]